MEEIQTWRELLRKIISDPQERQRIAEELHVNPITLIRWTTGKSRPRPDNLRPLLDSIPHYREQLQDLISKEFPHFSQYQPQRQEQPLAIPQEVYAHIISIYATSPFQLRTMTVRAQILQYMVEQLDPQQQGLATVVMQCLSPGESRKIRSLRKTGGWVTQPYELNHESLDLLFGAESQVGNAISNIHPVVIQNREEKERSFSTPFLPLEESSAAFPILLGDCCAGALYIISTQPGYFTPTRLELIRNYMELLTLAFEASDYAYLYQIELWVMPPAEIQLPLLASFHQRVTQRLIQAVQAQQCITRPQAEWQVWQDLEAELQHRALERRAQDREIRLPVGECEQTI